MKKNLLLIIVFLGFVACDDFLEPKSDTLYIPKDVVSLDEMLLGSAYPRAAQSSVILNAGLQFLDDDVSFTSLSGTVSSYDQPKFVAMKYLYSWHPEMFQEMAKPYGYYKGMWESQYKLILGANAALDYVDDVTGTIDEKTLVKAQAYALRALYEFNLVNIFGEPYNHNPQALGIPLRLSSGVEKDEIARNTVKEVYDQVIKDLNEAEKLYMELPENLQYRQDMRTSLPMVQLLKSRVFLYMENWKEAAKYAKKVIDEWDFSLIDLNVLELGTTSRTYYPFISQEASDVIWVYGSIYDVTSYYGLTISVNYTSRKVFLASPELIAGFKEGDLRKEWYVYRESNSYTSPYADVFLNYGKNVSSYSNSLDGNCFLLSFRLAEAYLNLAEAAAFDGDVETALRVLNDLREKRFTPGAPNIEVSGLTGDALVNKIREERRQELCFEFHRWFDLRRYGMPSIKHVWNIGGITEEFVLQEKDPGYTLPIPEVVMNQNRALIQNKLAEPKF